MSCPERMSQVTGELQEHEIVDVGSGPLDSSEGSTNVHGGGVTPPVSEIPLVKETQETDQQTVPVSSNSLPVFDSIPNVATEDQEDSSSRREDNNNVVGAVTQLLETQRLMMETQAKAMSTQAVPPLRVFTGDDPDAEDDTFERWLEGFEECAKMCKWDEEQKLFQLKLHLQKTAEHVVCMMPAERRKEYDCVVDVLRKRFRSLDIEELKGLEFHQLMQGNLSVEQLRMKLQRLARKAFPESPEKDFDQLLKGRFYQALLPKWQRKLGAPRPTETFEELYARARTQERHEQQFTVTQKDSQESANVIHRIPFW